MSIKFYQDGDEEIMDDEDESEKSDAKDFEELGANSE